MGSVSHSLTRNPRPRLLHCWGASLLTIAQKIYQQAEHFHGPVGYITRTLASTATPVLNPMQHQWLSVLSFIDDKILSVEDLAMTIFPHSFYLFSMVDEFALLAESLPKRYDDAINTLSSLLQYLPLFDPVVKPVLSVIGSWEWRDDKEGMVDIYCEEQEKKMVTPKREEGAEDVKNEMVDEKKLSKEEEEIKKVEEACKEIIEELGKMGMADSGERNKGEKVGKNGELEEEEEQEKEVQGEGRDPVLALFDEGWGTGIGKKRGGN